MTMSIAIKVSMKANVRVLLQLEIDREGMSERDIIARTLAITVFLTLPDCDADDNKVG